MTGAAERRAIRKLVEKGTAKRLEEKVKMRRTHYKYNTGQEWGMFPNDHLSLDSGPPRGG